MAMNAAAPVATISINYHWEYKERMIDITDRGIENQDVTIGDITRQSKEMKLIETEEITAIREIHLAHLRFASLLISLN